MRVTLQFVCKNRLSLCSLDAYFTVKLRSELCCEIYLNSEIFFSALIHTNTGHRERRMICLSGNGRFGYCTRLFF